MRSISPCRSSARTLRPVGRFCPRETRPPKGRRAMLGEEMTMRERRLFVTDKELATLIAALRHAGQHSPAAPAGGHGNDAAGDAPTAQDFDQLRQRLGRLAGGGDDL